MMPYIWLAVIVTAVVVEAMTWTLVSIWFVPGALFSMILSFFPVAPWIQIIVFLVVSLLFLIFLKPLVKKFVKVHPTPTNADSVIGEEAIVTEEINNLEAKGQVKVNGMYWTARSYDKNMIYEVGEVLHIVAIEGVKLVCEK